MTQPRKEQINDQRTYYTRVDSVGVTVPVPLGTPDVPNGTVQTIQNTIVEPYYNEFLASTITGAPGGAEQDSPAYFYGNSGPFSPPVAAGATFTITLPNINSGNPVAITFQPSDVFDIGGTPFITTSAAAKRINAALTAAGVSPTSPVALNTSGQLVLLSAGPSGYTYGASAFITVNDLTVGVCSALGFAPGNAATSIGISSPKRGIITTVMGATPISPNGPQIGGYVALQLPDGTPAITKSPIQVNVSGFGNLPLYPPGQTVFGELQQFTDTTGNSKFTLAFNRKGAVPGRIRTSGANCATLLNTDTFQVTVSTTNPLLFPGGVTVIPPVLEVQNYTFTVSFGSTPTGPLDVINAVNAGWNTIAATLGFPFASAGTGGVFALIPGPWNFVSLEDTFWIVLNGNTPIKIAPTTGVYSAADMAAFINAAIAAAGQSAQGNAVVVSPAILAIASLTTTGPSSTVQIIAGDPVGSAALPTNSDTRLLDKLGLSPGIYAGSIVAKLYGNDEIQFTCPDHTLSDPHGTASGITVAGSSTVLAKLGLTGTSVTGNAFSGTEPVTPPVVYAIIPEMMYFGEVPENIETTAQQFAATDEVNPVSPGTGTGNLGVSPLLGLDGKVNPDLIHKIFESLNVKALTLGSKNLQSPEGAASPRLSTPFATTAQGIGITMLWEGVSTAGITGVGASQVMRLFADGAGGLWATTNANQPLTPTSPLQWNKDVPSQSASAVYIGQAATSGIPKVELLYAAASVASPFVFSGEPGSVGNPPVGFDPSGAIGGALGYLQAGTTVGGGPNFENLIPRLLTSQAPGDITLIWEAPPTTVASVPVPGIRIYVTTTRQVPIGLGMILWFTINANWSGTAWQKDVSGVEADAVIMWQTSTTPSAVLGNFTIYYQAPADNTPWVDWGTASTASIQTANFNGPANEVQIGTLVPGFNIPQTNAGRPIPRILAGVDNGTTLGLRTLMTQWGISGVAGGGGAQTRVYRGYGFTAFNSGGPGNNDFSMITHNAGWNPTTSMWVQDDSTIGSSMQTWSNVGGSDAARSSGQVAFYTVPEGSGTFGDASWAEVGSFTRVGLLTPFTTDPYNSLGIPNLTGPANTIKAWGIWTSIAGNPPTFSWGPGGANPSFYDSWNISAFSWSSLAPDVATVSMYVGLDSFNFAVIASPLQPFTPDIPAQTIIGGAVANAPSNSEIDFFFWNIAPSSYWGSSGPAGASLETINCGASFVVLGRQ